MIDKQIIANLRLVHGSYNIVMMFLFLYQGTLGLRIRRNRTKDVALDPTMIRRHRKTGPVLAVLGPLGFLSGASLVYIDYGHALKYPLHLFTGLAIAASIFMTFLISRKIKGPQAKWRNRHFILGIIILCLYLIQAILGLSILL